MSTSDSQLKANAKHDKKNFEYFTVKARKGKRDELKKHVTNRGIPLNRWINDAIEEKLEKEKEQAK